MNYRKLVKNYRTELKNAGLLKITSDIAALLDNPTFGYPKGEKVERYAVHSVARIREPLYHALCAHFTMAKLPLPPLEREFYESALPEKADERNAKEAERIREHVCAQIVVPSGDSILLDCMRIAEVLCMFPGICGWGSLRKEDLIAKLNSLLVPAGLEPVRPDYASSERSSGLGRKVPGRLVRILAVDDSVDDLGKTLLAIAGWPNTKQIPFHYERSEHGGLHGEAKTARMLETAQAILACRPDIILLDEGMIDFDGSELMPVIRGFTQKAPLIVANTGGTDEKQRAQGAFPNFDKGEKFGGLIEAVKQFA